jgi:hypothetical protein
MKSIRASYTDKAATRGDGLENKECPLCGNVVIELDMEDFHERGTEREIECCTTCRENFEEEAGTQLDSDVLEQGQFAQLSDYAQPVSTSIRVNLGHGSSTRHFPSMARKIARGFSGTKNRYSQTGQIIKCWIVE